MSDLERLLAKEAITDGLHRYARGADLIDMDMVLSVLLPGATVDYGPIFTGDAEGFAEYLAGVHSSMETTTHHISNIVVTVDGDRATSESYVIMRGRSRTGDDVHDTLAYGRYEDEWERSDGQWRISSRRYLHTLDEIARVETTVYPPSP